MLKKLTAYVLALIMLASVLFGAVAAIQTEAPSTAVSLCDFDWDEAPL